MFDSIVTTTLLGMGLVALVFIYECVKGWWQGNHMPDDGEIPDECPLCGSIDGDCQHYPGE